MPMGRGGGRILKKTVSFYILLNFQPDTSAPAPSRKITPLRKLDYANDWQGSFVRENETG